MNAIPITGEVQAVQAARAVPADDVQVIVGARRFDAFYAECHGRIANALAITLGNPSLGAEAADEAMARAYAKWSDVSTYANPSGWVYRVGLNWARSLHRRLTRRLPWSDPLVSTMPDVSDPTITEALQSLDVRMRSVVVCRLLLDWSVDQTATALDIRPGTVKSRLSRALSQLSLDLAHLDPKAASPKPSTPLDMQGEQS